MFCLIFAPIRIYIFFCCFIFSLFLFISIRSLFIFVLFSVCFTRCLCSALWRAAAAAVRHLLVVGVACSTTRATCCNLVNLASANEIFICLSPPVQTSVWPQGHTHTLAWLTPIPKQCQSPHSPFSFPLLRPPPPSSVKLCVKVVWLNNFGTCPARCTLIALHTSRLRQRRSRSRLRCCCFFAYGAPPCGPLAQLGSLFASLTVVFGLSADKSARWQIGKGRGEDRGDRSLCER